MGSKKQIYLAGAMGCYGEDKYPYLWRKEAERYIKSASDNFKIFSPIDYYNYQRTNHYSEKEIIRYEFRVIKNSDILLVNLKDLDKSIGTNDEILYAYLNNIPIVGFIENSVCGIHAWKEEQIDRIEMGDNAMTDAIDYIVEYYGY